MLKRLLLCTAIVVSVCVPTPRAHAQEGDSATLVAKYWDGNDEWALDVARCESGFNEREQTGSHYGIFQLSRQYHEQRARDLGYTWDDMWDAGKNTVVALDLFADEGTTPWESSRHCWG